MIKKMPTFAAVALSTMVVLVGGCGSSEKNVAASGAGGDSAVETTSSSTLADSAPTTNGTGSDFVAAGDRICRQVNEKLASESNDKLSQEAVVRITARRVALEQVAMAELKRLKPPVGMQGQYASLLANKQTLIDDLVRLGEYAMAKKRALEAGVYVASTHTARQMAAIAAREGFRYCGQFE